MLDDPMLMLELAAAKREEQDAAWRAQHVHDWKDSPDWHADQGRKAQECFPCRGLRFIPDPPAWHAEYHGGRFEDCPAPTCSGEVPA